MKMRVFMTLGMALILTAALREAGAAEAGEFEPYPAPAWKLPDGEGALHSLGQSAGHRAVLIFYRGVGCVHCVEQLSRFGARVDDFSERSIDLIGIGTDQVSELKTSQQEKTWAFPLLADPEQGVFKSYGLAPGSTGHGIFVVDAEGAVQWYMISNTPYMDVDAVLLEADALAS